MVTAGVLPKSIFLIERNRVLSFRKHILLQLVDQGQPLGTREDRADRFVEAETIVGVDGLADREEFRFVGFPGDELLRRLPEIPVRDLIIEVVKLLLLECAELRSVVVVRGDRDLEFHEEFESRVDRREFLARKKRLALFFR